MWYCATEGDDLALFEEETPWLEEVSTTSSLDDSTRSEVVFVSGQVRAKNVAQMVGFPKDAELAKKVHPLPKAVGGMLLTSEEDDYDSSSATASSSSSSPPSLLPVSDSGHIIKVFAQRDLDHHHHSSSFFSRKGSTTVMVSSDGRLYGDGVVMQEYRRLGSRPSMVLEDCNGKPMAMCRLDSQQLGRPTYHIYGRRPLPLNHSSKSGRSGGGGKIVKECGVDFHLWFSYGERNPKRFRRSNSGGASKQRERPYRSIQVWNDRKGDFVPMWRAYPSREPVPKRKRSYEDKDDDEKFYDNERIMTIQDEKCCEKIYGTLVMFLDVGIQVTIAPGVDPALMLCLAAIQDDCLRDVDHF